MSDAAGPGLHQNIAGKSATFEIEVNAFGSQICAPPEVSASAVASLMSETCTGLHQSIAGRNASFRIKAGHLACVLFWSVVKSPDHCWLA